MAGPIKHDVSGTAFVVNYSRSRMENVSKDRYAHLWVTRESIELWNDLAKHVYPNDDLNVSLRNRFYLERLLHFMQQHARPVFVNIASGFANYPFLVEGNCSFYEFDLPNITEFKKCTVAQWMKERKLPERTIHYLPIDLNDGLQRRKMKETLHKAIGNNPSFVILEGVTYYLGKDVLWDIFSLLSDVQNKGSMVAFDYWKPNAMDYPVMVRLKEHLDKKFGYSNRGWDLFDESFIREIRGFTKIESTDIAALEVKYSPTRLFQGSENKIPVHFSVLKRV